MMKRKPTLLLLFLCFATAMFAQERTSEKNSEYTPSRYPTKILYPKNFYVSTPVRDMPVCDDLTTFDGYFVPKDGVNTSSEMSEKRKRKLAHLNAAGRSSTEIDPLIQGPEGHKRASSTRTPIVSFESIGLNVSPPDPSMAVGPNHVVTMENGQWAVFDKTGVMASGFPKLLTDPLSGPTHADNAGDPVVMYDREADRWFLSQFQLSGNPSLSDDVFLIGVSTTPDPTGSYNVYEYELTAGNDYPHYGIWGDTYVTAGNFTGAQKVYTFNRNKMLAGDGTAEIVGFSPSGLGSSGFAAPIPAHSEASGAATGDAKILFYQDDAFSGVTSDHVGLWNIDMDWTNATTIANSTISGKIQIPTSPFDAAIAGGFANLQQPGTTQRIDAIVGAVMNMCHWYKFPTYESILLNWVVEIQNGTQKSGIRWVEMRSTDGGASWSVYQEGTFTDPAQATVALKESVFMGCMSMDDQGNIGLGYTKTGSSTFPSLYYTGRLAGDALGTMTFGENLVISGTNSVTGNDRYGDYGQAVRDPSDDKTFWVTSEYSGDGGANGRQVRVYSFKLAPDTPEISFSTTAGTETEDEDGCFTDVTVPLNIALAPSANADVTFVINGSSTATTGVDFDLLTPNVTFGTGSSTSQNMILRVYHDGLVEGDETVTVDFTVNANGGDATANTSADSYTLTISSPDVVPLSTQTATLFSDGFETYSDFDINPVGGWTMFDGDGDSTYGSTAYDFTNENYTGTFIVFNPSQTTPSAAGSNFDARSGDKGYYCFNESIAPQQNDDYIFTPQIALNGTNSELKFWAKSVVDTYGLERFQVGVSTTDTNPASFTFISASPYVEPPTTWTEYTYDLSAYDGQNIYITFHVVSADAFVFMLDDVSVTATVSTDVQTAENSATQDQMEINGTGTRYAQDTSSDNVMIGMTNNNSFDYGCVSSYVSRAGTSAQSYNGSSAPNLVMDKTFTITPSNTAGAGDNSITFYFTEAEIAGWESATGLLRANLVAARGTASSVTETSALTIGSFGSNVTLTGTFTGLNGNYYFGTASAFVSCAGVTKTWDGATWSPAGAPDATNEVILAGNYNTNTDGNLNACKLTVNSGITLTVPGSTFTSIAGDIIVNGTVVVEHEGSVVQTNANPIVQNNGTINVNLTTPNLASRDFMVMGSPMTTETRESVWNTAFLVLDAETANFVPHPDVEAMFPGAENFADDNNDFWSPVVAGTITPGEGYIVRPQAGYGQPGGVFNYTYDGGTLNTGPVNFTVVQNTPGPGPADNKNASPNVLANPYPSAILADDFISANSMIDELYFWEHLTPPSATLPGAGSMNFSMEDISMYNLSGGTAAASDGTGIDTRPNGYVSTGQGFGIKATAAGTAVFTNAMRRTDNNNTLRVQEDRERIWLNLSTSEYSMQKQALLAFNGDNATEGMDPGYDSRRLATVVSLYTHLQDGTEELGIQTLGQFDHSITVPVGFSTLIDADTEYKISIADIEGVQLTDSDVYLVDHLTGAVQDLRVDSYGFVSGMGTFHNRFTLHFSRVLGTESVALESITMFPNPTTGQLNIASPQAAIEKVEVYDLMGRMVTTNNIQGNNNILIDLSGLKTSVYFVTLTTDQGVVTKKIVKK
ncbi:choice-of-anchor J domain-containing protein [Aureisphaera galaxeae]|uniref:T9SS-dependent choice-of-anchor J family protein n=1 Tax=Aureisphaera galaxeae TaxID=1538023 RepID=UPI002350842B|nr:choice-of-anchor J domain-containing protein [Aureisphaera galaxeae]MDC8003270.1 choice-of-anchor J domain-containing protein [Aureisphaera galaxeae]